MSDFNYWDSGSSLVKAFGQYQSGRNSLKAAKFEATGLRRQANSAAGTGQRRAASIRRSANMTKGRAMAVAAASGGGAADASVLASLADIETEGLYAEQVAMYEGEEAAIGLRDRANAIVYQGRLARKAGDIAAVTTVLSAGSKAFSGG